MVSRFEFGSNFSNFVPSSSRYVGGSSGRVHVIYAASASALDVKYGNKEVFINFPLAGPSQHQHRLHPAQVTT